MQSFQGSSIVDNTAGNVAKLLRLRMSSTLMVHVESINQMGVVLTANITALQARNNAAAPGVHQHTF